MGFEYSHSQENVFFCTTSLTQYAEPSTGQPLTSSANCESTGITSETGASRRHMARESCGCRTKRRELIAASKGSEESQNSIVTIKVIDSVKQLKGPKTSIHSLQHDSQSNGHTCLFAQSRYRKVVIIKTSSSQFLQFYTVRRYS
jgi:hypothetical protein